METTKPNLDQIIIIGLDTGQSNFDYTMNELVELAKANNMQVLDRLDQALDRPNAATYFGKGKVEELANLAAALKATTRSKDPSRNRPITISPPPLTDG